MLRGKREAEAVTGGHARDVIRRVGPGTVVVAMAALPLPRVRMTPLPIVNLLVPAGLPRNLKPIINQMDA
jgi:hypothetical protein